MKERLLGARGEALAEEFLLGRGYRLLARNYRCGRGEIDLIARDGGTIAFVEVKGKRGARFGLPLEAVTPLKQRRIAAAAAHYLAVCRRTRAVARFDAVGIRWRGDGSPEFTLVKDAFRLPVTPS